MLTVSGLSSGYQGAKVLHQVSFDVAAGEIVCLLGRNGAGKSTCLKTIMGLRYGASDERLHLVLVSVRSHYFVPASFIKLFVGRCASKTLATPPRGTSQLGLCTC